ncbi:MAG: hypothetical protein GX264_02705 [Clostridiales bacterium]|jgi:hypothetical protein|nr:hypothetical protein [Clostridiales bacterium]
MKSRRPLLIFNIVWWLSGAAIIMFFAAVDPKLFYIFKSTNRLAASGLMRLYALIIVPILLYAGIVFLRAHRFKSPLLFDSGHKYIILSLTISLMITLGSLLISAVAAFFTLLFSASGILAVMLPVVCLSAIGSLWSYIGLWIEKRLRQPK